MIKVTHVRILTNVGFEKIMLKVNVSQKTNMLQLNQSLVTLIRDKNIVL